MDWYQWVVYGGSVVLTWEEGTKVLTSLLQKRLPTSYSDLKRGINHRSEIPNGGMQDAFLSERTLCIHADGSYIGVQ